MKLVTTSVYEKIAQAWFDGKRHIFIEGGTAASKTYSTVQFLILLAQSTKVPLLISIVAESIPHIKRGALRDFKGILGDDFQENKWNRTDSIYDFGNGKIEFFSADEPSKLRGGRRDILFINEINNIVFDSYRELDARTKLLCIADWNPVSEFFLYQNGLIKQPDTCFIHCTYKDALNVIPSEVVSNIKAMGRNDLNWAHIYLDGLLGKVEGLVYPYFEQIDQLPEGGQEFYGLDFGYSNDPSVLVRCKIIDKNLYCKELIFLTGLTNDAIAHRMDEVGVRRNYDEIWADAAEPKSIDEIHKYGFNVKPCPKGADSVEHGHQKVRQYKQYWTKDSLNCIKEQRNFRYIEDKDGKYTEKTTHEYSHGMDARRYGVMGALSRIPAKVMFI
jgi:phage terminase large subunit